MPAPIAKGIFLSISFIIAAGAAVYEHPQVKQWVDENRQKVADALHNLGDELAPQPQRRSANDPSTREDESPEAVERRRRARDEILERGRLMEERKRAARQAQGRGMCFDDLVHKDGSLKQDATEAATATAVESHAEESGLRHRGVEHNAENADSPAIPRRPYVVKIPVNLPKVSTDQPPQEQSRSSTPTLPKSPPVPPKPAAYQALRPQVDPENTSNHPSEQLIDLTATTSASSAEADLAQLNQDHGRSNSNMYMSVNEWAHNQSVQSFHSPPQSISRSSTPTLERDGTSVVDSVEHASQAGTEDMDVMSDFSVGIDTPSTWTEVGSQISED